MLVGSMNTTGAPCCASGATGEHAGEGGSKAALGAGELDASTRDAGGAGDGHGGDGNAVELNADAEHVGDFTASGGFGVTSERHDERGANTPW